MQASFNLFLTQKSFFSFSLQYICGRGIHHADKLFNLSHFYLFLTLQNINFNKACVPYIPESKHSRCRARCSRSRQCRP